MGKLTAAITLTPRLKVTSGGNDSVEEAMRRINRGETAHVATLEVAREVLALVGLDEEQIEDRIHFGLTGETLTDR